MRCSLVSVASIDSDARADHQTLIKAQFSALVSISALLQLQRWLPSFDSLSSAPSSVPHSSSTQPFLPMFHHLRGTAACSLGPLSSQQPSEQCLSLTLLFLSLFSLCSAISERHGGLSLVPADFSHIIHVHAWGCTILGIYTAAE